MKVYSTTKIKGACLTPLTMLDHLSENKATYAADKQHSKGDYRPHLRNVWFRSKGSSPVWKANGFPSVRALGTGAQAVHIVLR